MIATSFCKKFEDFKNSKLYLCFFINENKTLKEVLISQLKQLKDKDFSMEYLLSNSYYRKQSLLTRKKLAIRR